MRKFEDVTILDCEYMYRFMNKCAVCSNGEVTGFQSENHKEGE